MLAARVRGHPDDELLALQAVRSGAQDYFVKGHMQGQPVVRALRHAVERKRVEIALQIRNQQLIMLAGQLKPKTKLSSSLDNLAEIFVHELNNPLARISGQLEELFGQFTLDDPRRAALLSIHAEVERMGHLVAKGFTNKEIAKQLSLSVRTVERYSSLVMNKLGLHNRAELITYAVRKGIVYGDDVPGSHRKTAPD